MQDKITHVYLFIYLFICLFLILCIEFLISACRQNIVEIIRTTETVGTALYYSVIVNYIADRGICVNVTLISELPGRGTALQCLTFCTFTDGSHNCVTECTGMLTYVYCSTNLHF
jgi:hypothetical protein